MIIVETQTIILDKELQPTLVKRFDNSEYTKVLEDDKIVSFQKSNIVVIPFPDSFYRNEEVKADDKT